MRWSRSQVSSLIQVHSLPQLSPPHLVPGPQPPDGPQFWRAGSLLAGPAEILRAEEGVIFPAKQLASMTLRESLAWNLCDESPHPNPRQPANDYRKR